MIQSAANSLSSSLYGFDSLAPASRQPKGDARAEKTPKRGELTPEQQRQVEALSERLTHDPFLSEALHEVLTVVTSVRSIW